MRAVVLIGHGSLRPASGAAMIRLAARVRERGIAPIAGAGFLNYSRPPFLHVVARCVAQGASEIIVVPYFLVPGKFVQEDVPRIVAAAQQAHPTVNFQLARPFGDHPALAELILKRAAAAAAAAALTAQRAPGPSPLAGEGWMRGDGDSSSEGRPSDGLCPGLARRGLLIMAHGSPDPASNRPIYNLASQIEATGAYVKVSVAFMELNQPTIKTAIDTLVAEGIEQITALPFFLQLGGHVAEELPAAIRSAQARHPTIPIVLSEHLGYDVLLCTVIADRVEEIRN